MKNMVKTLAVCAAMLAAGGCGFLDNKADKVLGLDDVGLKECMGDLSAAASMLEKIGKLSVSDMLAVERVSNAVMAKLKAEWIPQLQANAAKLDVKEFSVEFDEEDGEGVLLLPDGNGKYSGFVQGTAKADGDKTEFIFRIEATVSNGAVSYQFKRN